MGTRKLGELEQALMSRKAMERLSDACELLKPLIVRRLERYKVGTKDGKTFVDARKLMMSVVTSDPEIAAEVLMHAMAVTAVEDGVALEVESVKPDELEDPKHD